MITQLPLTASTWESPRRTVDQFSVGPVQESSSYRSCTSLYLVLRDAHPRALRNTSGKIHARARARLFVRSRFNGEWRDVDTCVLSLAERHEDTYSRSSLPGELEFLAADRILSPESRGGPIYARRPGRHVARGALYIHNAIHQNVVTRPIVYRCPSEFPGMYFPKTNAICPRCRDIS